MGKSSKETSGAVGSTNLLLFEPEKLLIVTDKNHPLYDERADLSIDESLVLNIMVHGVLEPILVRNNGRDKNDQPIVEVIAGRQRVKACIEANKRLKKEGKEPHNIPATVKRVEQGSLMGIMISENEIRQGDSQLVRARKLERYLATGKTEEDAAIVFGVTKNTVKNLLKILELHPTVQKAIERDNLPTNVAKELSVLPQEDQPAALEKLVAAGATKGARGVEAAKNVRKGGEASSTKVRMLSRNQLLAWKGKLKEASGKESEIALAVVNRVLGTSSALSNFPKLKESLGG